MRKGKRQKEKEKEGERVREREQGRKREREFDCPVKTRKEMSGVFSFKNVSYSSPQFLVFNQHLSADRDNKKLYYINKITVDRKLKLTIFYL